MLDAGLPAAIVVGRTLSSYYVGGVQNHAETITYTVYNEQAKPLTGLLLTDTLANNVAYQSASQLPDRSGQNLAWSLGTIQGFDRASVTLTVSLPATIPLQLDLGAKAFAMLDAGAVSNVTPAATLRSGSINSLTGGAALLASTPDANTTDPFIQEEAAKLSYDSQQIFNFLENDIGYNSYLGSVRGARGTLWSSAGNALDVASLGVALMRASGIPAQYEAGTLSQSQAQQLILSMFPTSYQTVGFIATGAQTADPANDSQLLSETESHYWFQFDAGSGMTDADPLMAGATIGQTFTAATGTFAVLAASLRATTQVQLVAEITNTASALFGLGGQQDTTVLDQTFDDVDLVGRPLSLGFNTSSSAAGFIFTTTTNTYTPYLAWGNDAYDSTHDQIITGQDFQEVLTNLPFGTTVLTGLFLNVTETGLEGTPQSLSRTLVDRIGYAARQGAATTTVSIPPGNAPAVSNLDIYTLDITAAAPNAHPTAELNQELQTDAAVLASLQTTAANAQIAKTYATDYDVDLTRVLGNNFLALSQLQTSALARASDVAAYYDSPRIVLISQQLETATTTTPGGLITAIDLVNDSLRVETAPNQSIAASYVFNITRGLFENLIERDTVATLAPSGQQPQVDNTFDVFNAAAAQGIGFTEVTIGTLAALDGLNLPADARARITADVMNGFGVIVPDQSVMLNGVATIAWAEINLATGEYIGVDANGGHEGAFEFLALVGEGLELQAEVIKFFAPVAGIDAGELLSASFQLSAATGNREAAQTELEQGAKEVKETFKAGLDVIEKIAGMLKSEEEEDPKVPPFLTKVVDQIKMALPLGEKGFNEALDETVLRLTDAQLPAEDPVTTGVLSNPQPLSVLSSNQATGTASETANIPFGAVSGTVQTPSVSVSNQIAATWSSIATNEFQATNLNASGARVLDSTGQTVGTGNVALAALIAVPLALSGNDHYSVNGTGNLSFYGPAESSLGVSGNWNNYSAIVTGNVSITVMTSGLILNGQTLAPGTYTITTPSATLSGSGSSTTPNFSGMVSITSTNDTIDLGAGTGNVTVGAKPLDVSSGSTLTGYNGSILVAAGGGNHLDVVTLNGNAANVLTVSATPSTLTTNQNTPVTFQTIVKTSFADTYNLTAQAPAHWTVTIDSTGKITATPAPGLQSGMYPIQVVAQSTTNPNLVAQTTVNITINPTAAGIIFSVTPDSVFTVLFNGVQVPSAFRTQIQNIGPAADTYNLSFPTLPSGFTVLNSGTSVTVPAGQTGILGIYLQPNGTQLPPPGSQASFTVQATSTSDPSIMKIVNVSFTMPDLDAVTISSNPAQVSSSPDTATTTTLTLQNLGNVAETVTLAAIGAAGLKVSGLTTVTLAVGQTKTETVTLTPATNAALNSRLATTITATYGPVASPQTAATQLTLVVRSVQTKAISQAAGVAAQTSDSQLANNLSELGDAVSQLQATPTDSTVLSRVQFLLGNLSTLLSADPALASFAPQLQPIQADVNAGNVAGMLALLPSFFSSLTGTLTIEATQQFTISVSPGEVDLTTGQSQIFPVQLTNIGPDPVTVMLGAAGVPSGITAQFAQTQVTLAVGATQTVNLTLTQTQDATHVFTLAVTAAASVAQQTATAVVAVRPATADVLGVTVDPLTVNPGDPLTASAQIFNTANVARDVQAQIEILDISGGIVSTLPNVPVSLVPGAGDLMLNLGQIATTGLAVGVYSLHVALLESDGSPLPGQASQAVFGVGQLVTATATSNTPFVPPGNSTVATSVSVTNHGIPSAAPISGTPVEVGLIGTNQFGRINLQTGAFTPTATLHGFTSGHLDDLEQVPGGLLYGMTSSNDLVTIDPVTATETLVGHTGNAILGLAARPSDGALFGISYPTQALYTIDPTNGAATLIGSMGTTVGGFEEIRFDDQGHLFLVDQGNGSNSSFYSVNVATGQKTLVGSTGFSLYGMDFVNGAMFGLTTDGKTIAIDTTTGAGTFVANESGSNPIFTAASINYPTGTTLIFEDDTGTPFGNFVPIPQGYGSRVTQSLQDGFAYLVGDSGTPNVVTQFSSGTTVVGNLPPLVGNGTDSAIGDLHGGVVAIEPHVFELDLVADSGFNVSLHSFDIAGFPHLDFTIASVQILDGNGTVLFAQQKVHIAGAQGTGQPEHTHFVFSGVSANKLRIIYDSTTDGSGNIVDSDDVALDNINFTQVGASAANIVVTHNLPVSGYTVDPASITPTPTSASALQDVWNDTVPAGAIPSQYQLSGTVANMSPGEVRPISTGTTVASTTTTNTGQQLTSTVALAPLTVAAKHIIGLTPPARTSNRNATAIYTVKLTNPLPDDVTYNLAIDGLTGFTTNLATSALVHAGQTVDVPLNVTIPASAMTGTHVFTVSASTQSGAHDSVEGQLTVNPTVDLPSLAVRLSLKPAQATAGQGTSARYTVTVSNVGDALDSYNLTVTGLPAGVSASLSPATVTVAPGEKSFRTVILTLTASQGTSTAAIPFQVTATSSTSSAVTASANGTLTVVSQGVKVTITPSSSAPGSTFKLTVTNTGTARDTFDLSLAGPAALIAKLTLTKVTLAPGASTMVNITTQASKFAVPGALSLIGIAKSEKNLAVRASATASIQVPATTGLAAQVAPSIQLLRVPGTSNFLVLVQNIGNSGDSYTATIMGAAGPIKGKLMGLDGKPTKTIPAFRLPGLGLGVLFLETNLLQIGIGTVTVQIQSLTNPAIKAKAVATVSAPPPSRGRRLGPG